VGKIHPAKVDHQLEPSVASDGVTQRAKRTQGLDGPRYRAPKEGIVGADAVREAEGSTNGPSGRAQRSHRSLRTGHVQDRVVQEPGRPLHLSERQSALVQRILDQAARGQYATPECHGSERKNLGAEYRKSRATGDYGMGEEESEHRIVPTKPGNRPNGTWWREGGARTENRRRER